MVEEDVSPLRRPCERRATADRSAAHALAREGMAHVFGRESGRQGGGRVARFEAQRRPLPRAMTCCNVSILLGRGRLPGKRPSESAAEAPHTSGTSGGSGRPAL